MTKNYLRLLLFIVSFVLLPISIQAQAISIERINTEKEANNGTFKAQIDFISESANLIISENGGETIQAPKERSGKYVYTCICDVNDTNKFGFIVGVQGGAVKENALVYIEEGQLLEYEVKVIELPVTIEDIKSINDRMVVPIENTAKIFVTSNYNNLVIESNTGEIVEGPVTNESNTFGYTVTFNLSTPESKEQSRSLIFKAGKEIQEYDLGVLQPKSGKEIAVIVVNEGCYISNMNHITQCFRQGLYYEAYTTYKELLGGDICPNMDSPTAEDNKELEKMKRLAAAHQLSDKYFNMAEKFVSASRWDSAMYYHGEALKYRNLILKSNSSDPYCLEYNKRYDFFKASVPRIVSGRIVDNAKMNSRGENLPLAGVYIVLTEHKRSSKKVNGIEVPSAGKEIGEPQLMGESDSTGNFTVYIPRNTKDTVYQLNFTADKESMGKKSYGFEYVPKDVDKEDKLVIRINPKNVNK